MVFKRRDRDLRIRETALNYATMAHEASAEMTAARAALYEDFLRGEGCGAASQAGLDVVSQHSDEIEADIAQNGPSISMIEFIRRVRAAK